jgi:spore germination protein GerM
MRRVALAVLCALVLAACGVSTQSAPKADNPDDVPFGLLDPKRPDPPVGAGTPITIYLLADRDSGVLVPVDRRVPDPVTAEDRLHALNEGPTEEERAAGRRTAIPADVDVFEGAAVRGGVAEVSLDPAFRSIAADVQVRAIAQIVYTLTAAPGVGRVSFFVDDHAAEVPRGDGTLTSGSVSRDSYPQSS